MNEIIIKEFTEDRAEEVKLLVMTVHKEFGFSYDKKLDYDLDNVKNVYMQSNGGFWIALYQDKVIGCTAIKETGNNREKVAELKRMYLYPEFRGKGIGKKLFELAQSHLKEKGYKTIVLDTTSKQGDAIKFYEKNGFTLKKRIGYELYYSKTL